MVQMEILLFKGKLIDFVHESHHGIVGSQETNHEIVKIIIRIESRITAFAQDRIKPFPGDLLIGAEPAAAPEEDQKADQGSAVKV